MYVSLGRLSIFQTVVVITGHQLNRLAAPFVSKAFRIVKILDDHFADVATPTIVDTGKITRSVVNRS